MIIMWPLPGISWLPTPTRLAREEFEKVPEKAPLSLLRAAMPQPYSLDLRWRIVWLCLFHQKSKQEVAALLHVSTRTVDRYIELFLSTGDVAAKLRKNGPDRVLSEYEEMIIIQLVNEQPGIYLYELQYQLLKATGTSVDCSTICRSLKRLGFSRQQICHIAKQQSDDERMQFLAEIVAFEPDMLVWLDETGFNRRNGLRKYGYGLRGLPPKDFTLKLGGHHYSSISIMTTDGVEDIYVTDTNVDGEKFMDFIETTLLPILLPFNGENEKSVVIMDNAVIHHMQPVIEAINSVGAIVRFLPRYSPDFNPIELVFAEVKAFLKEHHALMHTVDPRLLITYAFNTVSVENCIAYVRHAGYM